MNRYYYDLHIHSCLSPCADNDNTPNNIAGMGQLAGLQIMALTDHNTCRNCPAFFKAAKKYGIIPIAGMELTTAEDIHMVCLFETLEQAMAFDAYVATRRVLIPNRRDIFGDQLILDENDELIEEEAYLLSNATDISVDESVELADRFGGVCYPAHIDRDANGIIAVLGDLPAETPFACMEFHDGDNIPAYETRYQLPPRVVVSSDAHYLWDIRDKQNYVDIDDEPYSSALVRERFIQWLRGARA